jgi:hypothetical protein
MGSIVDLSCREIKEIRHRPRAVLLSLLTVGCFNCLSQAEANPGDFTLSQRTGYVNSKGDLSRDKNHIAVMLAATRSFSGPKKILGIEFSHRFALLYDSFYTLDEINLLFPLVPRTQARIIEPSVELDGCLFAPARIHPCVGAGFSGVYIQSSVRNYQIYSALPLEARIVYATTDRRLQVEGGVRYRGFQNRVEGFVARHLDLMPFLGFGMRFAN